MSRNGRRKKGRKKSAGRGRPLRSAEIAAAHQAGVRGDMQRHVAERARHERVLNAVDPIVTFVIPTLGRDTLNRTLESLVAQTDDRWTAIIVGDGLQPAIKADRFESIRARKTGSAGPLRNVGMKATMSKAPWFGFVDDDDVLTPDYVERLAAETTTFPGAALVLFRMLDGDGLIKPAVEAPKLEEGWVGISFAVRREWPLEHGVEFQEALKQDIGYVNAVRERGGVIYLSEHVAYKVRP